MRNDISKNIHLDRYLRVGDRVVMNLASDARDFGNSSDVPDGTVGTVVGFYSRVDYRGRINNFGMKPGQYYVNGAVTVMWDNGITTRPGAGALYFLENNLELNAARLADKVHSNAFEADAWFAPLPELPIWEHDLVEIVSEKIRRRWDSDVLKVKSIDWHNLGKYRNDGSPMPIYECGDIEGQRGYMSLDSTEVRLKERGNVFKWYNNQKDQIVWPSLAAECQFHIMLGLYNELPCAANGNKYHWPLEAVRPALEAGVIDVISGDPGLFGSGPTMRGYKFTDQALSDKARAKALEGLSNDS